jgi:hypothetical protein
MDFLPGRRRRRFRPDLGNEDGLQGRLDNLESAQPNIRID